MNTIKNILFITIYSGIGGGESLQLNLMEAMDTSRYKLHLLTPKPGPFPEAAAKFGVTTHLLPYRGTTTIFVPALWQHFPITGKLRTFLREHQIDAVMSDYHSLPFIVPAAESLGIPVMWNAMGWWFPLYVWQRSFFRQRVRRIVAITQNVKDRLIGTPPKLPPDCIEVLIPGVDANHFHPNIDGSAVRAKIGIGPEVPLVGMAARFQEVKGHEYFLDAARHILKAVPHARLVISGDNTSTFKVPKDEAYKQHILDRWQNDPLLHEGVTFLGFWPDVREVIAAADVMVCPSRFESLLMLALESMSMETPIVSTRVGGPSETIIDGVTGYLVPPQDGKLIAEHVIPLLQNPELCRQMGKAARQHVLEHLSVDRYAAAISSVFDHMIEGDRSR